jgi:hypothetical protein
MKRLTAVFLVLTFTASAHLSAVDGDKAAYAGGTYLPYAASRDPIEGELNTQLEHALVLTPKKKQLEALSIPYDKVIDLEYGQKAGRRVGLAVGLAVINPVGLATLFSKKRKHFLTVGYFGEAGKEQVAVLELGKDIVKTTLAIVETRSGKNIEYQDEEAQKASRGD